MAKRTATVNIDDLKPVVEALIFATDEPLSAKQLRVLIEGEKKTKKKRAAVGVASEQAEGVAQSERSDQSDPSELRESLGTSGELETVDDGDDKSPLDARVIRAIVDALNADYEASGRSFVILEIAGGFLFATRKEYGLYVGRLAKDRSRRRLSQAALETLAIVAYRQPISKPDVEAIRGVNCDEVLSSLMERVLITITGRADSVGRPLLYGTTDDFLKYFGLASIKDLPRPREIDEMMESRGILADQTMLELSTDENVAQIEEHLTHNFPAVSEVATENGEAEERGSGEAEKRENGGAEKEERGELGEEEEDLEEEFEDTVEEDDEDDLV